MFSAAVSFNGQVTALTRLLVGDGHDVPGRVQHAACQLLAHVEAVEFNTAADTTAVNVRR